MKNTVSRLMKTIFALPERYQRIQQHRNWIKQECAAKNTHEEINRHFGIKPLGILLLLGLAPHALAKTWSIPSEMRELQVSRVTTGLNKPWSIAFISESEWLVTERGGQLRWVLNGELQSKPVTGLPKISEQGQGGLLDVAIHPEYKENNRIYLSYAAKGKGGFGTDVLVATFKDGSLSDSKVIFSAMPKHRGGRHFGSRLAFDRNNNLYISLGDRGQRDSSQNTRMHAGSIIRLRDDGGVPEDNPFIGNAEVLDSIFSIGHRNVQGMVYDSEQDILWAHEHGPQGGDELNRIMAGQNYGWPVITYGVNYGLGTSIGEGSSKDGMQQPVTYWDPSIAPSGLAVVNSEKFPQWQGNLLVGALKFQLIARLQIENGNVVHEERLLEGQFGRIRDVRQGPDGNLYFLTDSADGAIFRIE